jgi:hypothetical protein
LIPLDPLGRDRANLFPPRTQLFAILAQEAVIDRGSLNAVADLEFVPIAVEIKLCQALIHAG